MEACCPNSWLNDFIVMTVVLNSECACTINNKLNYPWMSFKQYFNTHTMIKLATDIVMEVYHATCIRLVHALMLMKL